MLDDLRYAFRMLMKSPGFTAVAVLTLALGIGASSAVFSVVDRYVFGLLEVKNPHDVVLFEWTVGPKGSRPSRTAMDGGSDIEPTTGRPLVRLFPRQLFEQFRTGSATPIEVFAVAPFFFSTVEVDGESENILFSQLVSGNYFSALGVPAIRGRTLGPDDDRAGSPPAAVISHGYWHRRFAKDPATIGKTIWVNRVAFTIVGITPPDFIGTEASVGAVDITLPLSAASQVRSDKAELNDPSHWWVRLMGRIGPGVHPEQLRATFEPIFQSAARQAAYPPDDLPRLFVGKGGQRYSDTERAGLLPVVRLLTGMVVLVLVTACANVANLLVARGSARRRELAIRLSVGGSRARIVRQLLTESLLIAAFGAALGLLAAAWGVQALATLVPGLADGYAALRLDARMLGFAIALAMLTGLVFGLAPALRSTRLNLNAEFQGGPRQLGNDARSWLSRGLMVVQVAVSLVLLVGAGLFVRTMHNLHGLDVGFDRSHLLLFTLRVDASGFQPEQYASFFKRVSTQVGAVPGVQSVSYSSLPLIDNKQIITSVSIPGVEPVPGQNRNVQLNHAGIGYFETYSIPIVLGRSFIQSDDVATSKVVIVNQAFARRFFPDQDALGERIRFRGSDWEIVGIARDVKQINLRAEVPPTLNITYAQNTPSRAEFAVRTTGDPSALLTAIRQAVRHVDGRVPLTGVRTQEDQIERTLTRELTFARFASILGLLALALASVGLYGLMSYVVQRRTGEIGLRMALGALRGQVRWTILRQSLTLVAVGVLVGLVAAFALKRFIAAHLFGISPVDPLTYSGAILVLTVIALLASWLPARRASNINPMVAMRSE